MFTKSCTQNDKFIKLEKIIFFLFGCLLRMPPGGSIMSPGPASAHGDSEGNIVDASAVLYVVKYAFTTSPPHPTYTAVFEVSALEPHCRSVL